eukprot:COSAG06_NODE_34331_length_476_cov_0.867374_1_plen_62_part_10
MIIVAAPADRHYVPLFVLDLVSTCVDMYVDNFCGDCGCGEFWTKRVRSENPGWDGRWDRAHL